METSVYAQLGSRSRTVLFFACVIVASGVAVSYVVDPLAGLVTLVCTWCPGVFLIGLALKLRQVDLRYGMASWFYREYNMILPGDTLQSGVRFTPRGLFGSWRFEMPLRDGEGQQFWTVVSQGRGHALYTSGVLVEPGVGH